MELERLGRGRKDTRHVHEVGHETGQKDTKTHATRGNRCTTRYRLEVKAGKRAIKYEKKLESAKEDLLKKECWRIINKENVNTEREKRRKEFMERRGWSQREANRIIEEGDEIEVELE